METQTSSDHNCFIYMFNITITTMSFKRITSIAHLNAQVATLWIEPLFLLM